MPHHSRISAPRLARLVACGPLLAQLAVAPILQAQDSTSRTATGPRRHRVGIASHRARAQPPTALQDTATQPRAACIVRDLGIGVLAGAAGAVLVSFGFAISGSSDKKELRQRQRKAFWIGFALGVARTLIRLREPCDIGQHSAGASGRRRSAGRSE